MKKLLGVAVLAMGAALMPAAFCQTQTDSAATKAQAGSIPVEDQATKEQVERLFDVMRLRQQMSSMMKQMSTMMQQQVGDAMKSSSQDLPDGKKATPEQITAQQQLMAKFMDRATKIYTVDEMIADATPIYQQHISKSDIEAFIAFFGSSAGQHFLDQQPLIMQEYMPVVMKRVQENTKTLTEEMKKELDELHAKETEGSTPQ
jgi:hypothetical protein